MPSASPTIRDVAAAAGVSIKTVSNVVNGRPKVGAATRTRVQEIIEQLGYRPNLSARGLRSGRSGVIALAVPSLRESYFAELADDVIRAATARGLRVVIEQTNGDRDEELAALSGGQLRFVDGLLFSPAQLGQADADALVSDDPIVLLGERIFGGPTDHVTMHNTSSSHAATDHLLGIGRTRVALIGATDALDDETSSASLRERGYRRALETAGMEPDERLIVRGGPWRRETGVAAVRRLLADGTEFDAIFALNDTMALGALRALAHAGLRVPDDVAVMGFDNIDDGRYSLPSLTTVDPGRREIAQTAVDLLVARIEEKGARSPVTTVKAAFTIVRRESTGFADDTIGRTAEDGSGWGSAALPSEVI